MNLLLVGRNFIARGGAASRLSSLVDFLSQEHRISVLTMLPANDTLKGLGNKNLHVFNCPIKPKLTIIPFFSIVNVFLIFFYVRRLLQQLNVDVLLVTIPEFEEGVAAALAARGKSMCKVIEVRDLIVEDHVAAVYGMFPKSIQKTISSILRTLLMRAANSFELAVTVTSTLRKALLSEGIRIPIHVVTNGADTTLFHPTSLESKLQIRKELGLNGEFIVLYAGAMGVDYYPMEVILDAFEIVAKTYPSAQLVLCGSWSKKMELLTSRLGNHVKYLGLLGLEATAHVMRACDIGLITMDDRPSTFVALTTKFFEYLASGLPVIAACPSGGELDQIIATERIGYTVATKDYRGMAERIMQLMNDETHRSTMAKKGEELVSSRFDRKRLAETYRDLLLPANNGVD